VRDVGARVYNASPRLLRGLFTLLGIHVLGFYAQQAERARCITAMRLRNRKTATRFAVRVALLAALTKVKFNARRVSDNQLSP
jgi:hypothetical protein